MLVIPHRFILWKLSIFCRFEVCICLTFFFLVKRSIDHLFPMQGTYLLYTGFAFLMFKTMKTRAVARKKDAWSGVSRAPAGLDRLLFSRVLKFLRSKVRTCTDLHSKFKLEFRLEKSSRVDIENSDMFRGVFAAFLSLAFFY